MKIRWLDNRNLCQPLKTLGHCSVFSLPVYRILPKIKALISRNACCCAWHMCHSGTQQVYPAHAWLGLHAWSALSQQFVSNTLNCARLENNMEQCVNRCNPQHSADCANWNNASLVATVNSIAALEQEKHYCQSGSGCLSLSKGSLHVWLSVIWWPLTDLKALLQSGQVLLDHPSAAFPPLFPQSSKNHLISSVHCGSLQIK